MAQICYLWIKIWKFTTSKTDTICLYFQLSYGRQAKFFDSLKIEPV